MTDYASTEGGALIRVKVVAAKFTTSHTTNRMDEVGAIEIFKPVLIRVVGIGTAVEIISRRILSTLLVTCIL